MKQTAVEFLMNEMPLIDWKVPYWKNKLEQAKKMEKEQIEQAFNEGDLFSHNYDESGEKYYIYTFEK